jgi:D-beta-D-heptose 7-phosphate kinase/D-beta-D-heptose 1-phosphate adenosyltransferase
MLDHNIYTTTTRVAVEAPVPIFSRRREDYRLGGCGNVLKNLHALGCSKLYLFGTVGDDSGGHIVRQMVSGLGVHAHLQTVNEPTIVKQRYFCDNKIVFRCDTEGDEARYNVSCVEQIENILKSETIDCIVLSDYNKGFLYTEQCMAIIELATRYGVFTSVDPKKDYSKYIGCSLFKPNRKEAIELFGHAGEDISDLHIKIKSAVNCRYSVITQAEKGISLYDGKTLYSKHVPEPKRILDVTGAGDIVCAILSYFIPMNTSLPDALQMATRIATKSVEYVGTYTIQPGDVRRRVVFTNGCFDILHAGHIKLLKFCRERGDMVIVGLNSDASVQRLKGIARPVNTFEMRKTMLESISYVDQVIGFDEDTPLELVKKIRPNVLVKGGDYTLESIIGREYADETLICESVNGISTTSIINRC